MKKFESKLFSLIAFFLSTTAAASGANEFEGYSPNVGNNDRRQFQQHNLMGNMSTIRVMNPERGRRVWQKNQLQPAMR
ncbi:MAG TPA: hypothetical protein VF721_10785 [Pyrinomonadaceae bacterium]|jgi:hypothetical protein